MGFSFNSLNPIKLFTKKSVLNPVNYFPKKGSTGASSNPVTRDSPLQTSNPFNFSRNPSSRYYQRFPFNNIKHLAKPINKPLNTIKDVVTKPISNIANTVKNPLGTLKN